MKIKIKKGKKSVHVYHIQLFSLQIIQYMISNSREPGIPGILVTFPKPSLQFSVTYYPFENTEAEGEKKIDKHVLSTLRLSKNTRIHVSFWCMLGYPGRLVEVSSVSQNTAFSWIKNYQDIQDSKQICPTDFFCFIFFSPHIHLLLWSHSDWHVSVNLWLGITQQSISLNGLTILLLFFLIWNKAKLIQCCWIHNCSTGRHNKSQSKKNEAKKSASATHWCIYFYIWVGFLKSLEKLSQEPRKTSLAKCSRFRYKYEGLHILPSPQHFPKRWIILISRLCHISNKK